MQLRDPQLFKQQCYLNGQWVCASNSLTSTVYNPYDGTLIGTVPQLDSAQVQQAIVGNGLESGVTMGPLINDAAVAKVKLHIADATAQGALVQYGTLPQTGSRLFEPHVLTEMTEEMLVAQEETFGPLAPLFRFSHEEEVIERANHTDSGLAAYCYTQSLARAWRLSEALEVGIVGINEGLISTTVAPFGGIKESGFGREGAKQGLDEYLEVKYTLMGGLN